MMATEAVPLALWRASSLGSSCQGGVGVSLCFLCALQLGLDLNKCLAVKATELFVFRFLVRVSYLEIYNEEVRDLLGKDQTQRLEVSEGVRGGMCVRNQCLGGRGKLGSLAQVLFPLSYGSWMSLLTTLNPPCVVSCKVKLAVPPGQFCACSCTLKAPCQSF